MVKTVEIVSLSAGTLGEDFIKHELDIGLERLRAYGLTVRFAPHALAGRAFIAAHPEARAADLLAAFRDPRGRHDPVRDRRGRHLPPAAVPVRARRAEKTPSAAKFSSAFRIRRSTT